MHWPVFGVMTVFLGLLAGCAHKPLISDLRAQNIRAITLAIEDAPFSYSVSDTRNTVLTDAARRRGVLRDHRQLFADDLIRGLKDQGLDVRVVRLPFLQSSSLGARKPNASSLGNLPIDRPAYYLAADFGECFRSNIEPCMRFALYPLTDLKGAPVVGFQGILGVFPRRDKGEPAAATFRNLVDAQERIGDFDAGLGVLRQRATESLLSIVNRP
jgi:hypothetical protein